MRGMGILAILTWLGHYTDKLKNTIPKNSIFSIKTQIFLTKSNGMTSYIFDPQSCEGAQLKKSEFFKKN